MFKEFLFLIFVSVRAEETNIVASLVDTLKHEGSKISTGMEKLANQCGSKDQSMDVLNAVQNTLDLQVLDVHQILLSNNTF